MVNLTVLLNLKLITHLEAQLNLRIDKIEEKVQYQEKTHTLLINKAICEWPQILMRREMICQELLRHRKKLSLWIISLIWLAKTCKFQSFTEVNIVETANYDNNLKVIFSNTDWTKPCNRRNTKDQLNQIPSHHMPLNIWLDRDQKWTDQDL